MSYCHWSNSDIFLYTDEEEGAIICFECQLEEESPTSRYFYSHSSALSHVEKHLALGDNIPERVLQILRREIEEETYEHSRRFANDVPSLHGTCH